MIVDTDRLITPSEYARSINVSPAAVTKMMNEGRVESVQIKGGRLVVLPKK